MQFHRFKCLATVSPRNKIVMLVTCWLNLNIIITGAALGFVFISLFLSIFVELGVQTTLTRSDKAWVGNWWLGFIIFGAICIFWSVWLLGYPKEFPLTKKLRERMEIKTSKVCSIEVMLNARQDNILT